MHALRRGDEATFVGQRDQWDSWRKFTMQKPQ